MKLEHGEYITSVQGRTGAWTDKFSVYTNKGRVLHAGGEGGGANEPNYPPNAYVVGFDTHFHHSLCRTEIYYVTSDDFDFFKVDPLLSLITDSDLLSKGLEDKHMNVLS